MSLHIKDIHKVKAHFEALHQADGVVTLTHSGVWKRILWASQLTWPVQKHLTTAFHYRKEKVIHFDVIIIIIIINIALLQVQYYYLSLHMQNFDWGDVMWSSVKQRYCYIPKAGYFIYQYILVFYSSYMTHD